MIRKIATVCVCLFTAASVGAQCLANTSPNPPTKIPAGTKWAYSPTVAAAVAGNSAVGTAIDNAAYAWYLTNAVGRLAGWSGAVTGSDCPSGQPFQVSAYPFYGSAGCPVAATYQVHLLHYVVRAFADMNGPFYNCPTCGTKSISINLSLPYSINPAPASGEYDLQSTVTHEFGHVLGFGHMDPGYYCDAPATSDSCWINFGRNTMNNFVYSGEVYLRDLSTQDISNANLFCP